MKTSVRFVIATLVAALLLGFSIAALAADKPADDAQKKDAKAPAAKAADTPAPAADKAPATDVKKDKPQTVCPVMGGAINKKVYTDYQGKRVYFCCPMCIDTFKKDPEKYMKKMADEGIKLEDTPKAK